MKPITLLLFVQLAYIYTSAQVTNIEKLTDFWDIREHTPSDDRTNSFVQWLKDKNFKTIVTAQSFTDKYGLQLKDLLSRFGFDNTQDGWEKLRIEMDLFPSGFYEFRDKFTSYVESITPTVRQNFSSKAKESSSSYVLYTGNPFHFVLINPATLPGLPAETFVRRKDSSAFDINSQIVTLHTQTAILHVPAIPALPMPSPVIKSDSAIVQKGSIVTLTCVVRDGQVGELNPGSYWITGTRKLDFRLQQTTNFELTVYKDKAKYTNALTVKVAGN